LWFCSIFKFLDKCYYNYLIISIVLFSLNSRAVALQKMSIDTPHRKDIFAKLTTASLNSIFKYEISPTIKLVALGEVSHGGYEPIAFKADMIKYLVQKKGFRLILFEEFDLLIMREAREYLNNSKRDFKFVKRWLNRGYFPRASSTVYLDLFNWLKRYNLAHPKDKVQVVGFELGMEKNIINFILNKFIIPFDFKESEKYVRQLNADLGDDVKISIISNWFTKNKEKLRKELAKEDYAVLEFYIMNAIKGIDYLQNIKKNASTVIEANLLRDSLLAENVLHLSVNSSVIVWAHNAHVVRTTYKNMGTILDGKLGNKYYVVATDFSKSAKVDVVDITSSNNTKHNYSTVVVNSDSSCVGAHLANRYKVHEGIFLKKELLSKNIGANTNAIDVNGIHFIMPGIKNAFDAIAIFGDISPLKH
jgi:erythromycin esterase-like protein